MRKLLYCLALFGLISGCASSQLNYNTLDIASSYDHLIKQQFIDNVVKFHNDKFAIASYASLTSTNISTTNVVNPSISYPLAANITNTLASNVSGSTLNGTYTSVLNAPSAGLSVNNQSNQSHSVQPMTDADTLRRLALLYKYAAGLASHDDLLCDYPVPEKQNSGDTTGSSSDTSTLIKLLAQSKDIPTGDFGAGGGKKDGKPVYIKSFDSGHKVCGYYKDNKKTGYMAIENPDPAYMRQPGCIVCDTGSFSSGEFGKPFSTDGGKTDKVGTIDGNSHQLLLNYKLRAGEKDGTKTVDWIRIIGFGESIPDGFVSVGSSDGYSVLVKQGSEPQFTFLVLATLDATAPANYNGKSGAKNVVPTLNVGPTR
ncbi:MAG TPA: hypothetical protein VEH76_14935 [Methylocystis sp.]|nr:hypothetical protein [Methylocystis sp.]